MATHTLNKLIILIDYVKILFNCIDVTRLYNLPFLDFTTVVNLKTGEATTKKTVIYHFCKITIYESGLVLFSGSIHKLYNSIKGIKAPNYNKQIQYKGFNGNQFNINNIYEVRTHLEELFNCKSKDMIFQNIEFGVNTNPLFVVQQFLKGLLYQKGKLFEYKYNGYYAQVKHQRYLLKIYNKSNQYQMDKETLRVELKIVKTEFLKQTGIRTFEDITEKTLENATNLLLTTFDEVVYYDYTIQKKGLKEQHKQTLRNYSNPRYWVYNLLPRYRDRHKKKLADFIINHSNNLHSIIRQDIINKCVIINRLIEPSKCVIINSSYIGLNVTQNRSKTDGIICLVTGLNISMQKDSFLLSHTGIKYYKKTDAKVYNEIKRKYLSAKWIDANDKIQIKEIAHNIRNKYNNNLVSKSKYKNQLQLNLSVN